MKVYFSAPLISISCFFYHPVLSQKSEAGKFYYVVIGAFSSEQYAKDYVAWAKTIGLKSEYQMNTARKLFYIYTMKHADWGIPVQEAESLRKKDPKLDDAWVYFGTLELPANSKATKETPLTSERVVITQPVNENPVVSKEDDRQNEIAPQPENKTTNAQEIKKFYFKLFAEDGTPLNSTIELIDLDNAKLAARCTSNEKVEFKPLNKSGRLTVQSKVFGYRLKQFSLNFNNPSESEGVVLDSGTYQVPLQLKPLTAGDVAVMYNVFFFNDAGIMRPDSRYEVNSLVAMMKEFPNRKIIIHGHTNGGARGKIKIMNDKKNFFSLTGAVETSGSAVKLSEERAKCIQEYLISNGIDKGRLSIKAWGGKNMLYDKLSEKAKENVRVEIEILND